MIQPNLPGFENPMHLAECQIEADILSWSVEDLVFFMEESEDEENLKEIVSHAVDKKMRAA